MSASDGPTAVRRILLASGLTKSALCAEARLSRSLLDDYLKGRSQPSVAQLGRLAAAAGLEIDVVVRPRPSPVPESFVAVLEFGEIFPRKPPGAPC